MGPAQNDNPFKGHNQFRIERQIGIALSGELDQMFRPSVVLKFSQG
jgi:hypothetical protein